MELWQLVPSGFQAAVNIYIIQQHSNKQAPSTRNGIEKFPMHLSS